MEKKKAPVGAVVVISSRSRLVSRNDAFVHMPAAHELADDPLLHKEATECSADSRETAGFDQSGRDVDHDDQPALVHADGDRGVHFLEFLEQVLTELGSLFLVEIHPDKEGAKAVRCGGSVQLPGDQGN